MASTGFATDSPLQVYDTGMRGKIEHAFSGSGGTMQSLIDILGIPAPSMVKLDTNMPINSTNLFTTIVEVYKNQPITLLSRMAEHLTVIAANSPLARIFSPVLATNKIRFDYTTEDERILPAQPSMPGVVARGSSTHKTSYTIFTNYYSTGGSMPMDVLQNPDVASQIEALFKITYAASVACQITIHHHMLMWLSNSGTIYRMANWSAVGASSSGLSGYDGATDQLSMESTIGCANMGLDHLTRVLRAGAEALKPIEGRPADTWLIMTGPGAQSFLGSVTAVDAQKDAAFVKLAAGSIMPAADMADFAVQTPHGQRLEKINFAGHSFNMFVPTKMPITNTIQLPSPLSREETVSQFYSVRQRTHIGEVDPKAWNPSTHGKDYLYNIDIDDLQGIDRSTAYKFIDLFDPKNGEVKDKYKAFIESYPGRPMSSTASGLETVRENTSSDFTISYTAVPRDERAPPLAHHGATGYRVATVFGEIDETSLATAMIVESATIMAAKLSPDAAVALVRSYIAYKEARVRDPKDVELINNEVLTLPWVKSSWIVTNGSHGKLDNLLGHLSGSAMAPLNSALGSLSTALPTPVSGGSKIDLPQFDRVFTQVGAYLRGNSVPITQQVLYNLYTLSVSPDVYAKLAKGQTGASKYVADTWKLIESKPESVAVPSAFDLLFIAVLAGGLQANPDYHLITDLNATHKLLYDGMQVGNVGNVVLTTTRGPTTVTSLIEKLYPGEKGIQSVVADYTKATGPASATGDLLFPTNAGGIRIPRGPYTITARLDHLADLLDRENASELVSCMAMIYIYTPVTLGAFAAFSKAGIYTPLELKYIRNIRLRADCIVMTKEGVGQLVSNPTSFVVNADGIHNQVAWTYGIRFGLRPISPQSVLNFEGAKITGYVSGLNCSLASAADLSREVQKINAETPSVIVCAHSPTDPVQIVQTWSGDKLSESFTSRCAVDGIRSSDESTNDILLVNYYNTSYLKSLYSSLKLYTDHRSYALESYARLGPGGMSLELCNPEALAVGLNTECYLQPVMHQGPVAYRDGNGRLVHLNGVSALGDIITQRKGARAVYRGQRGCFHQPVENINVESSTS